MPNLPPSTHTEDIHILHVDDEPDFARLVAENLSAERDRFTVEWTTDPNDVTDILADHTVDCIISDYMMPELTGLDVFAEVQAVDPELPFILFTDTEGESVASEAISAGVSDYVIKGRIKDQYALLANTITTHVDRRRAEAAADNTEQQLHELAENTNDVLWLFSADWTEVEYINSRYETMFGRSLESLRENPDSFLQATHPDDVDDLSRAIQRCSDGYTQDIEYRIQAGDNDWKWVESHAEPIVEADTVTRIAGFTHDITERKQRELELRANNERLERFASIVSHDLRNPLSVADGYLEMARDEADSDHLETVADALDRMEALISEILVLAQEGQEITETELVTLDTVILSSWNNIDQQAATLQAGTNVRVEADKIRLGQVFENLFRNAIEHGGDDVTITVGVLANDAGFYVENNGVPIPEDKREQIFETGFTTNKQGTGFGLAIIKRIVTAHGWEIRATDATDGGARFEITGVELTTQKQPPE